MRKARGFKRDKSPRNRVSLLPGGGDPDVAELVAVPVVVDEETPGIEVADAHPVAARIETRSADVDVPE